MTEAEWLACADPEAMVEFLKERASFRKLRLFAIALCRQMWAGYPLPADVWGALDIGERSVVGTLRSDEKARQAEPYSLPDAPGNWAVVVLHRYSWSVPFDLTEGWRKPERRAGGIDLLRDVFGNPFRPVAFDPAWRTDTAVSLARQMYEAREFGAMPILADALQDAGCDNDDVLNHCRDANATHVRGCWVLDLVLGKE